MRTGRFVLISVLGALLLGSTALAKPGTLLDKGSDSGTPIAFAKGTAVAPKRLLIRVRAKPNETVEVRYDTSCSRGYKQKVRTGEIDMGGKSTRKLKKGFKRPDECLVDAQAAYNVAGTEGSIKIELFAKKR